jgi:hypothetical protein
VPLAALLVPAGGALALAPPLAARGPVAAPLPAALTPILIIPVALRRAVTPPLAVTVTITVTVIPPPV